MYIYIYIGVELEGKTAEYSSGTPVGPDYVIL
jgi:hypothetical protein